MKNKSVEKWSAKECEEWAGEIGLSKNNKKLVKKYTGTDLIALYNQCAGDLETLDEAFSHEFLPLGELKTLQFHIEKIRENLLTYNDDFVKYEKLRQEKKKKSKKKSAFSMNSTASFAGSNFIDDPFMFSRENILMRTPEEVGELIVLLWKYALKKYRTPISAQQIDTVTNDLKQCMIKMGINGEVFLEMKEVSDWNFFFAKELVKSLDMTELFSVIVYDFMPTKKE